MARRDGLVTRIRRWLTRPSAASSTYDPDPDLSASPTHGGRRRLKPLDVRAREALADFGYGHLDADDHLYRSMDQGARDLEPTLHDRQIRLAYAAYTTTPLGKRAIDLTTDYVVGDGLSYDVDESDEAGEPSADDVRAILDAHWKDPVNAWPLKLRQRVTGLGLWGEQCWPVFVQEATGRVRVGSIDPQRIRHVEIDPDNAESSVAVVLKPHAGQRDAPTLAIIAEDPETGELEGDCFYVAVNRVPGARRGHSDLLHVLDWIESYDDMVFNSIDAARLRSAITWDVLCRGATDKDIAAKRATLQPTPPGGALVHNESEIWTAVSPDIGAAQHDTFSRMIRIQILGGLGIPEHWFGEGDSATRATAAEMSAPVLRRLESRQEHVICAVRDVLRFVVDQAIKAGALAGTTQTKDRVTVTAQPFERRDLSAAGAVLTQATSSLALAVQQRWITVDTARRAFAQALEALGVEVDPESEKDQIDKEGAGETDELRAQVDALGAIVGDPASVPRPRPAMSPFASAPS